MPVDQRTAGTVQVSLGELERKLGRAAWVVWCALLESRDKQGITTMTPDALAERTNVAPRTVRKALDRMRKSGLVVTIGRGRGTKRRVLGARAQDHSGACALVPQAVAAWIKDANSWGGSRASSGRRKNQEGQKDRNPERSRALGNQVGVETQPSTKNQEGVDDGKPKRSRALGNQVGAVTHSLSPGETKGGSNESSGAPIAKTGPRTKRGANRGKPPEPLGKPNRPESGKVKRLQGLGSSGLRPEDSTDAASAHSVPLGEKAGDGPAAELVSTSLVRPKKVGHVGHTLGRVRIHAHQGPIPVGAWVPPYPGAGLLPPAKVPGPPKLDPEQPMEKLAAILGSAYRGASESRYKKASWVLRRGKVEKSKQYPMLCKSVAALIEHDISPYAWAAWSMDVWQRYEKEKSKKPPPLSWVFGAKRINERRGWFRSEASSYRGQQMSFSDAHIYLLKQYERMRGALLTIPPDNKISIKRTVAEFFPKDSWDDLLERAKRDNQDLQQKFVELVQRGSWLW